MKKNVNLVRMMLAWVVGCAKHVKNRSKWLRRATKRVCRVKGKSPKRDNRTLATSLMSQVTEYVDTTYELRYNVIRCQTEFRLRGDVEAPFRPATQRELNSMCIDMMNRGIFCWDRDLKRYIDSSKVTDYHPFRLFMEELPAWDGHDRVTPLAQRVSDDACWAHDFHRWLLGVAAQWMGRTGNHANSVAPILISRQQGWHKSTFCRALMPDALADYYTDRFDLTSQSGCERKMAVMGLINLDEFDKIPTSQMAQLKNQMQVADLNTRRAYERNFTRLPRVASFIGTSNRYDLLADLTGSRRFICVEVKGKIDCEGIEHRQLFAQLRAELDGGERYWFTGDEERAIQQRNEQFMRLSPQLDLFQTLYRAPQPGETFQRLTLNEICRTMQRANRQIMRTASLDKLGSDIVAIGIPRRHTNRGNVYHLIPLTPSPAA